MALSTFGKPDITANYAFLYLPVYPLYKETLCTAATNQYLLTRLAKHG